jgi:transposase
LHFALDGTNYRMDIETKQRARFEVVDRTQMFFRATDVESLIPTDHPARAIWCFLERVDLGAFSKDQKAVEYHPGRPAVSPQVLLSIWIYSYSRGMTSARQISREMEYEPGLQWLSGMTSVNHHTLSDFRVNHEAALQDFMGQVLGVLFAEGLVRLERVTQDGTKIRAQASRRSFGDRTHLQRCLAQAKRHVQRVSEAAETDVLSRRHEAARCRAERDREVRINSALASLASLEAQRKYKASKPTSTSITDCDARFMRQGDGAIAPSYNVQFTTDSAAGLLVGVAVSQARNDANELTPAMDRLHARHGAYPTQVLADGDFTNHDSVIAMHERGIAFFGSFHSRRLREPAGKGATYGAERFFYDSQRDQILCPEGKHLRFQYIDDKPGRAIRVYVARKEDCHVCPARRACTGDSMLKQTGRKVTVSNDKLPIRLFDERMRSNEGKVAYRSRAQIAEFPHAWIKSKFGLRQFRCRTLVKVGCEVMLAALTYNLKRYFQLRSQATA